MIAARYTQGKAWHVVETPRPEVEPGGLRLRIDATGICGTDLKIVRHGHRKLADGQTITLGHEFVGTVDQIAPGVSEFREGDRVGVAPNMGRPGSEMVRRGRANMDPNYTAFGITRDGSHAPYLSIPGEALQQGNVVRLPGTLSAVDAALAEPLSCAVSSVQNARVGPGDSVAVYGLGPMGLLNIMCAKAAGARTIAAIGRSEHKRASALSAGATHTFDNTRTGADAWLSEMTAGRGVDVVILAAPVPELQQEALDVLAPFGRLCNFAGWARDAAAIPLDTNPIHYKNLLFTGMSGGCNEDYREAIRLIADREVDVRQIVSHVLPISELERAYSLALSGQATKVVITAGEHQEEVA
ncbi:MAG: zinc-binding dehydrogenase [Planctomycetota bacterium]